mmetsp:Transcript_11284/g.21251  ORF Transcript_11284/g.21251 Transcript_11284/m.21251 type:complete len:206 (+) Transcript_11284:35-652(+)
MSAPLASVLIITASRSCWVKLAKGSTSSSRINDHADAFAACVHISLCPRLQAKAGSATAPGDGAASRCQSSRSARDIGIRLWLSRSASLSKSFALRPSMGFTGMESTPLSFFSRRLDMPLRPELVRTITCETTGLTCDFALPASETSTEASCPRCLRIRTSRGRDGSDAQATSTCAQRKKQPQMFLPGIRGSNFHGAGRPEFTTD